MKIIIERGRGLMFRTLIAGCFVAVSAQAYGQAAQAPARAGATAPANAPAGPPLPPDQQAIYDRAVKPEMPLVSTQLLAAACKEGKLTSLNLGISPAAELINQEFMARFPCIKVDSVIAASGQLIQRFEAERARGSEPDILQITNVGMMQQMAEKGVFQTYTPTIADTVPSTSPGKWYPLAQISMTISYNSDRVTPAEAAKLKTWKDVLDPAFKDKSFGTVSPAAGGSALYGHYYMRHVVGSEFYKEFFSTRKITVFSTSQPAAEALASGQVDILLPQAENQSLVLWDKGAPIRLVYPAPLVQVPIGHAIPAKAKNPNAAKLYTEFVLSPTAQKLINGKNFLSPANTSVVDQRRVAKEAWWSFPKNQYSLNFIEMDKALKPMVDEFESLTKRK